MQLGETLEGMMVCMCERFLLSSLLYSIVQSFESIVTTYAQQEGNMTIFRSYNFIFVAELVRELV